MTQLNYRLYMDKGLPGQPADAGFTDKNSFAAENDINFGYAVIAGTDPVNQVKAPVTSPGDFMGISIASMTTTQDANGNGIYRTTKTVSVLRRGRIWVPVIANVVANTAAYYVYSGADAGKFTGTKTGATAFVPTGVFRSSASAGEVAILEINLPGDQPSSMSAYYTVVQGLWTPTGGSATQDLIITGVLASDYPIVQMKAVGATPRTIVSATTLANTLRVVFSGDPSNDHTVTYEILRNK